ncbi:hypothetical protein DYB37_012244 [Aphanomyces astaci]|uniref:Uncharacterized protein n=1 Tax=Aphanomyces astaci TaxID=112090 RepID=A0A3R6ZY22_APHAT|nr:hypothetical protein DYB35_008858 [Aphanomyces astaci]RHZ04041.1 hypothetical protein DYB37_012244 [Aphanomyces astaci]
MENQVQRIHRQPSRSDKATVIKHLEAFLKKGKIERGPYKQATEQLNMDPHSVAYIRHTFCTRGTITSKKPGNVGPKQLIPLNSSKSSFMRCLPTNGPPSASWRYLLACP